ncbi:MAG: hypothetical protein J6Y01_02155, partial [Spirochaetales bacterium]|nr:hypothetical protein [Spirochaetales bacterium]
ETTVTTVGVKTFSLASQPKKIEYTQGETLDLTGLSGLAVYEDKTKKMITYSDETKADFEISDITSLPIGAQNIFCSYKGKKFILKISIIQARSKQNYWETNTIPADNTIDHNFWDNANVYFVLTDRFYNGDTNNDTSYGREKGVYNTEADATKYYGGDIKGLTQKLDYLADTGINAIWITAPYEQIHGWVGGSYPYHGYWTLDWTQMDANVGTAEEFRTFVDTPHAKGIRVIMDVVMNHPGYATLVDLKNLVSSGSVGVLKRQDIENADPDDSKKPNYHDIYIDYNSCEWHDWWGIDWVRAGFCDHYTTGIGELQGTCGGDLPDFITESGKGVSLSPMFTRKLADTTNYPREGYKVTDLTNDASEAGNYRMRDYLIKWLSDWVREFGIDGFRCDTAKYIEKEAWYQLKVACVQALRDWKTDNPDKKVDDSDFWMTGEVYDHDVIKDAYFSDGGFNSLINFKFKDKIKSYFSNISGVDTIYSSYANKINTDEDFNMLTYISSHDTTLCYSYYAETVANQKMSGSLLAFCPGAIQIYYGDECGRKKSSSSDAEQQTRSQMPWDEDGYRSAQLGYDFDSDIHAHWSKVLNFRKNHVAVGAGAHAKIADAPYTFSRVKGDDKVIVVLGASGSVEVDVSSVFTDGTTLHNGEETATVADGKVTFTADSNGVILIEKAE